MQPGPVLVLLRRRGIPLILLAAAGLVMEIGWLIVWTMSYRLTHGNDFTFTFLTTHGEVWERLVDLLVLGNRLLPGLEPFDNSPSLELVVNSLAAGFVIVGMGYLAALILLDRGLANTPGVMVLLLLLVVVFQATLFFMPGVYTTDIFSYVMYGHIAGLYTLNPYIYVPADFPANPAVAWIHPIWHYTATVYGPLWTWIGVGMARASQSLSLMDQVFAYKALMNVVFMMSAGLVWWLLGRVRPGDGSRRARITAFAVFVLNPLLLFEVAGNAHNDALMVFLLLLGVAPLALTASRPHREVVAKGPIALGPGPLAWLSALVAVGLGALVKYTTGLVGVFIMAAWLARLPNWRARLFWLVAVMAALAGITLALFWPWLQLPQVLTPILDAAGGKNYTNSIPDLAALTIADVWLDPLGVNRPLAHESARFWMKVVTRMLYVAYLAFEIRLIWRIGDAPENVLPRAILEASVRAFLMLLLFVLMWVLTWYFTWPLALTTLLGWRHPLTRMVIGFTLTSLPIFYLHHYWSVHMPGGLLFLYAVPPLVLPLALWLWQRARRPEQAAKSAHQLQKGDTLRRRLSQEVNAAMSTSNDHDGNAIPTLPGEMSARAGRGGVG